MEYNVETLIYPELEWKNNILLINENNFQIKNELETEEKNEIKTYSLLNASLIDTNIYDSNKGDSIFIGTSSYKINIKPNNKEDKPKIFSSLRKIINNNFSYDNENNINNKKDDLDKTYELLTKKLSILQNLFNEIIPSSNDLDSNSENNNENKINDIKENIDKIKTQLDLTIINFYKYHDLILKKLQIDYSYEEENISSIVYGDNIANNFDILKSYRCHSNNLNDIGKNYKIKTFITTSNYEDATSRQNILSESSNRINNKNKGINISYNNNFINKNININKFNIISNKKNNISNNLDNNFINNNDSKDNNPTNIINNINNDNNESSTKKIIDNIIKDNLDKIGSSINFSINNLIDNNSIIISNCENINDFYNKDYDINKIRKELPKPLTFPPNMVKEMVTNFTQKKKSLPVYFNEPISMGQKQCEKFYYLDLLTKASNEPKKEIQLCYISAFIIGEIFLNIGRSLKPFNPIIGETYEYFNNKLNFRYYSEQVSHKPPVTAFEGETPNFTYYGDTYGETSFKFFKGGMELSLKNKVHIILKNSGDHYTFIPPTGMAKGLMNPPLYVDYYGDVIIQNITNPAYKCELKFIEEGWTPNSLGEFEGTVYKDDKSIYLLGGNWKKNIYMTDPDGNNKIELLTLDENLKYLNNTSECYYLPEFTCDLNNLTEELKESLPLNDSRFKMDMRLLEEGNSDEAQIYKDKYEEKQRKELNNEQHKILFFKQEYDSENEINYYVPNGQYWEMKKNNTLKDNCNANIFDISNY